MAEGWRGFVPLLGGGSTACRIWGPPWQPGLCGVAGDSRGSRALKGAAPLLSAPCSRFPSRSPFVSKKQLFVFLFLFSPRGKFHCAIFSGDSSASCSNFALLLALPEGSRGVPGCGGCGRAAVCVQVEAVPRRGADEALLAPAVRGDPWQSPARPCMGCSTWLHAGGQVCFLSLG